MNNSVASIPLSGSEVNPHPFPVQPPGMKRQEWYRDVYLYSEHWKDLRTRKLAISPHCQRCGSKKRMDVHHLNYRNLYDVKLTDLMTLCRHCHELEHRPTKVKKQKKMSKRERRAFKRARGVTVQAVLTAIAVEPLRIEQRKVNRAARKQENCQPNWYQVPKGKNWEQITEENQKRKRKALARERRKKWALERLEREGINECHKLMRPDLIAAIQNRPPVPVRPPLQPTFKTMLVDGVMTQVKW